MVKTGKPAFVNNAAIRSLLFADTFLDHALSSPKVSDPVHDAFEKVTDAEAAMCSCEDAARVEGCQYATTTRSLLLT